MLCMLLQEIYGKLNELTKMLAFCPWVLILAIRLRNLYLKETSAMSLMYLSVEISNKLITWHFEEKL